MIVIVAWAVAAAVAIVVIAACGYELRWKMRRLRADLAELDDIAGQLRDVQVGLATAAARASTLTSRP